MSAPSGQAADDSCAPARPYRPCATKQCPAGQPPIVARQRKEVEWQNTGLRTIRASHTARATTSLHRENYLMHILAPVAGPPSLRQVAQAVARRERVPG